MTFLTELIKSEIIVKNFENEYYVYIKKPRILFSSIFAKIIRTETLKRRINIIITYIPIINKWFCDKKYGSLILN